MSFEIKGRPFEFEHLQIKVMKYIPFEHLKGKEKHPKNIDNRHKTKWGQM